MRIYTANECKDLYRTTIEGRHASISVEAANNIWSDSLDNIVEAYSHNTVYIEESFDLITWPDIDYLKSKVSIYNIELPSKEYFNGSACYWNEEGSIFLYGKSTPIPRYMTHYIVVHELGHIVQDIYCSESKDIEEYIRLRNVEDKDTKIWIDNWKQLWAEDFRWLFSIESAHQSTWSMNHKPPNDKVFDFMLRLIDKLHKEDTT